MLYVENVEDHDDNTIYLTYETTLYHEIVTSTKQNSLLIYDSFLTFTLNITWFNEKNNHSSILKIWIQFL